MTRKPYMLKEEEIEVLVSGMMEHGVQATYDRMFDRAIKTMKVTDDMDEMLMDMHDTVLIRARDFVVENDNDKELRKTLYQLANMLRTLGHEVYYKYIKAGKERDNDRFLRLVVSNAEVPTY